MGEIKVGVVGAGSVGLFLSAILAPQAEVTLFSRRASRPQRVVIDILGHLRRRSEVTLCGTKELRDFWSMGETRVVFICVKAHELGEISAELEVLSAAPTSPIFIFAQNGLGILPAARNAGLKDSALAMRMLCRFGVLSSESKLEVKLSGPYGATLAPGAPDADYVRRELLEPAGFSVLTEKSVEAAEWQKALINVFTNPVCALTNQSNGAVLDNPLLQDIALRLVEEAREVALHEGVSLDSVRNEQLLALVEAFRSNVNSHLVDLRRGRLGDMNFLLGEIEARAERAKIACPTTAVVRRLYAALAQYGIFRGS